MADNRFNRIRKTVESLREGLHNIYMNTERFQWTHDELIAARNTHIFTDATFINLPRWAKHELIGVDDYLMQTFWRKIEFSYEVKGERLLLSWDKYRKYSAEYIHKNCSASGAFAYSAAPHKLFTQPKTVNV